MPHGGADHLLIWGMIRRSTWGFRIGTLLLYPALSLLYLGFWHYQPLPAAIFFLSLTIFHWGQGDRYLSVKNFIVPVIYNDPALLKFLHILSRGSLPILLPGYLGTETYRAFLEAMIRQGGGVESDLSWISQNAIFFLLVPLGLTLLQLLISLQKLEKGEQRA